MWWRNHSLFRTDKLKYMIERHKKYINWWKNFLKGFFSFIIPTHSLTTADSTHPPDTEPEKSPFSFTIILLPVGLGEDPQV